MVKTTDLEKLRIVFDEIGVEYRIEGLTDRWILTIAEGIGKTTGYNGFYTEFTFNDDEEFHEASIWEGYR